MLLNDEFESAAAINGSANDKADLRIGIVKHKLKIKIILNIIHNLTV